LNPAQREAVHAIDGPLLVLAGAGTGKTRVITYRIAHMLESGIPPEAILGMTFTNKAAREMVERVGALVSDRVASKVTLGTFHSFCCRVLRKEISRIGFTPNFTIAADADQQWILRQAVAECGFAHDELSTEALASVIGREKNAMRGASEFLRHADTPFQVKAGHVYERYQQILLNQNMLDFDDILLFVVKIWEDDPACLEAYQARFSHILVDEYQDTNRVQFRLLELLSGKRHNLCVVGDDDQSIYSWRGARVEHILDFPLHFSDAKVVKLEQNYRSTNTILDAANQAISANRGRHEKNLWSEIGEGDPIRIVKLDHDGAAPGGEADFIGDAIQEYLGTGGPERRPQDIAVLYRSNYLSRQIEEAFRSKRIPYRIVGSRSFYQRKEILDAVAYL
jgi:superfamily I DNA/RNA helicase